MTARACRFAIYLMSAVERSFTSSRSTQLSALARVLSQTYDLNDGIERIFDVSSGKWIFVSGGMLCPLSRLSILFS